MADHSRPQFFLVRDNGLLIPLIALDELPHHVRIEGTSRSITIAETQGMTSVGTIPAKHQQYKIININDAPPPSDNTPSGSISSCSSVAGWDSIGNHSQSTIATSEISKNVSTLPPTPATEKASPVPSVPIADNIFPSPKKAYGIREQKPDSDYGFQKVPPETIAKPSQPRNPTMTADALHFKAYGQAEPLPVWKNMTVLGSRLPPPGKKVYCSHWMSTGECDYAQQGCMYRHEMPLDIELLNYLGYQDIPKWYREKHGIGKLTAVPGSGAHVAGPSTKKNALMQSSWRPGVGVNRGRRIPTSAPMARRESAGSRSQPKSFMTGLAFRTTTNPFPAKSKTHESKFIATSLIDDDGKGKSISSDEQPSTLSLFKSRYAPIQPSARAPTSFGSLTVSLTPVGCGQPVSSSSRNALLINEDVDRQKSFDRLTSATQARLNSSKTPMIGPHSFKRFSSDARRSSVESQATIFTDFESEAFAAETTRKQKEEEDFRRMREKQKAKELKELERAQAAAKMFNSDLAKKQKDAAEEAKAGVQPNGSVPSPFATYGRAPASGPMGEATQHHRTSKDARKRRETKGEKALLAKPAEKS